MDVRGRPVSNFTIAANIRTNAADMRKALLLGPRITAKYLHDGLLRVFLGYRNTFLAKMGVRGAKAGRSGLKSKRAWIVDVRSNKRDIRTIKGRIFTAWIGAPLLEHGGVVTPRKRRMLAIPIGGMGETKKARRGHATPSASRRRRQKYVALGSDKGALLFPLTAKGRRSKVPRFALVRQVRVRPQMGFFRLWVKHLPDAERRLGDSLQQALAAIRERIRRSVLRGV